MFSTRIKVFIPTSETGISFIVHFEIYRRERNPKHRNYQEVRNDDGKINLVLMLF